MSTAVVDGTSRPSPAPSRLGASPVATARLAGLFYLATILAGLFAQGFVSARLIDASDAAATATNILAHEPLYRLGFAVYLVEMACQMAMTALLYELLKPAGRRASLVAAAIGLVGCTIKTVARLFYFAPLFVLGGAPYLNVFSTAQLQALSQLLLKVNDQGAAIALLFFGVYALLKGYLILRSTFLPHALGVLSIVGGIGWLAFIWPPLGYRFFPYIAILGLLGSAANIIWMIAFGVNEPRWREQASAAAAAR